MSKIRIERTGFNTWTVTGTVKGSRRVLYSGNLVRALQVVRNFGA